MDNGIEVDAIVMELTDLNDSEINIRNHPCYVKFVGDDKNEHIAKVINISHSLPYGRKVKVRYLPGEYKSVLFISQELN